MSDLLSLSAGGDRDDPWTAEQLLPLVYHELRNLAASALAREKPGQTIQATALVHEAYVRLAGKSETAVEWGSRNHFLAAAAEAMRRILIENARRKNAEKRGGSLRRIDLQEVATLEEARGTPLDDLLALDDALQRFATEEPIKAELVKLRYFAGLSIEEAAAVLGISRATAVRYWDYSRSWLYCELGDQGDRNPAEKNSRDT